jgi:hypothetical protein
MYGSKNSNEGAGQPRRPRQRNDHLLLIIINFTLPYQQQPDGLPMISWVSFSHLPDTPHILPHNQYQ